MPKSRGKTIKNYPSRPRRAEADELKITNKRKNFEIKTLLIKKDKSEEIGLMPIDNANEFSLENEKTIDQLKNNPVTRNDAEQEKIEQEKKMLMWVGVSCIMIIFFVVWSFNLRNEFNVSLNKGAGSGFNWNQTKVELDKAMAQIKQGVAEIKKIQAGPSQNANEPKLSAEQLDLLKGKLLNEVASSTASSTRK